MSSVIRFGSRDLRLVPDRHPAALFVQERHIAIVDAVRNMVAPLALGLEPNERYEAAREGLSDLRPVRLADAFPARAGGSDRPPQVGTNPHALEDLTAVRVANTMAVRQTGRAAQSIQHAVRGHDVLRDGQSLSSPRFR